MTRVANVTAKTPRAWYRYAAFNKADLTKAELHVFDYLGIDPWTGEGIGAKQFIDELNALPGSVTDIVVHVNSGGGNVFDAVPIANALRNHPARIDMRIEGIAASAATIVTMAGDTITIAENALVMIHDPWSGVVGGAKDMRAQAEALDRVTSAIIATYQWHSKLSHAALAQLMVDITWMDAEEAVANGFATEIGQAMKAAAHIDARIQAKVGAIPEKYAARLQEMRAETDVAIEQLDDDHANPPGQPDPTLAPLPSNVVSITATRERQIQDREIERSEKIGQAFAAMARSHPTLASGIEDLRKGAITNRLTVEAASRSLIDFLAATSSDEIQGAVSPLSGHSASAGIDTKAIYEKERNARKRRS